jgi:hypothetical protein
MIGILFSEYGHMPRPPCDIEDMVCISGHAPSKRERIPATLPSPEAPLFRNPGYAGRWLLQFCFLLLLLLLLLFFYGCLLSQSGISPWGIGAP